MFFIFVNIFSADFIHIKIGFNKTIKKPIIPKLNIIINASLSIDKVSGWFKYPIPNNLYFAEDNLYLFNVYINCFALILPGCNSPDAYFFSSKKISKGF